jgi:lactate dehydrogenase-like 2-hydroxyacid dehydrogenase
MSDKPRVLVTRRWPAACEQRLSENYSLTLNETNMPMGIDALKAAFRDYDAVLPTVTDTITAEVLSQDPMRCRFIGNFGVGFNHIDMAVARSRGLVVSNTPDVLTDCTADIALLLLLMAARRATEGEALLREGQWTGWHPTQLLGTKVAGKTLGLVGFGRIAQAVAKRAHFGFGMKILAKGRRAIPSETLKAYEATEAQSLEALLAESDFVSLHCPGGAENRHLINRERLALMPRHSILVNTARGDVVDSEALINALKHREIQAAGLDVYEGEPHLHPGFLTLDNVSLLPHLGSATEETRAGMGMRVIDNLDAFIRGESPPDQVS